MTIPDVLVEIAGVFNCSADEALQIYSCVFLVALALLGFSVSFFLDTGDILYRSIKRVFCFFRKWLLNVHLQNKKKP